MSSSTNDSKTTTTTTKTTPWQSCFRPNLFQGKVALVTGGGTGIGKSISIELASLGATVVIASRDPSKCQSLADDENVINTLTDGKIVAYPGSLNIRKPETIPDCIEWILQQFSQLNLLVNNAGGQFVASAEDISVRGMTAVLETNLRGTFLVCKEAWQQYMSDHGGSIVNITLGNRNGMPMMMHSGAARAGVENMTATLSTEWIHAGVRINCVRPGLVWTESGAENYGPMVDVFLQKILPSLPAQRFSSPEEIASAVVWLLSDGASYVTGQTISVDGASAYTYLPLVEFEGRSTLPVYGTLPPKAKL